MATSKQQKLIDAKAQADKQYWAWAWDYIQNALKQWKSLADIRTGLKNNQYTKYTNLTWEKAVSNTKPGWTASDLSYVKPSNYYGRWNWWDYNADITKDAERKKQMEYNLKSDMTTNPKLFKNRDDYDKYYNYANRSDSQKKMLDEYFDNANKYELTSDENRTADAASDVAIDKNSELVANARKYYDLNKWIADLIKDRLDDRLKPMFNEIQAMQAQWLDDYSELREMQKKYYKDVKAEYDAAKAWESASLVSQLSWQGLASGIIGNAVAWQDKVWGNRYNELFRNHILTLKDLTDWVHAFMNDVWNTQVNLTNTEKNYLQDWANAMLDLNNWLQWAEDTMTKEMYSPYEELTRAKVTWAAETAQSTWKSTAKKSEYQDWDTDFRRTMLYNNIWAVINDPATMAKLTPYIDEAAASMDDYWLAVNYIVKQLNNKTSSSGGRKINQEQVIETLLDSEDNMEWAFNYAFNK